MQRKLYNQMYGTNFQRDLVVVHRTVLTITIFKMYDNEISLKISSILLII
jgi:hypothetical protein